MLRRVLLFCFLACLANVAWGQDFGLDLGCCSEPLNGMPVTVDNGGGTFGYFNTLDTQITELSFNVNVGTLFDDSHVKCIAFDYFVCQTPSFNAEAGILTFEFLAPNAPETGTQADEGPLSTDTESREGEGIPTLLAGCGIGGADPDFGTSTVHDPDHPTQFLPCSYKGHFEISFNTFLSSDSGPQFNSACKPTDETCPEAVGTWAAGTTGELATVNGHPIPEPSSLPWLAAGVVLIVGRARYRRRRA